MLNLMNLSNISIRARILLWHGVLLACILLALGVAAWRLRWQDELRRIDRELNEPLSAVHRAIHYPGNAPILRPVQPGLPRDLPANFALPAEDEDRFSGEGYYYALWYANGTLFRASPNAPDNLVIPVKADEGLFATQWRSTGLMREAYRFTPPGACLVVGISTVPDLMARTQLGWWLLALGAGVLGAALLVDGWILRRAIQPVEEIISAAERISRGNLAARIETGAAGAELNRLTRVLNCTFHSLDQAFTQQARFSGDVAHELRTPVSVLITETQTALERERGSEEYRETISTCLRSARRMGGLIESLLELAQIQSGADAVRSACDLGVLTAEVTDSLRTLAEAQGVEARCELEKAPCAGNAPQLAQIITNLVINAIQHNTRGGTVLIKTSVDGEQAVLSVENTGPGIPAEDLPNVFARFYRADASRSRKTGGVGLGLAICKAIADSHGAELTVASAPGEWTRFCLRMPAQRA